MNSKPVDTIHTYQLKIRRNSPDQRDLGVIEDCVIGRAAGIASSHVCIHVVKSVIYLYEAYRYTGDGKEQR